MQLPIRLQNLRRWRPGLRAIRRGTLLFLFLVVGVFAYLNQVGLPRIIKDPILAELHSQGIDLSFSRMRWHWYRGIVLENVTVGPSTALLRQPRFTIHELEVQLDPGALFRFKVMVTGLIIHQGEVVIPLPLAGAPTKHWVIHDITADIQFLPDDRWILDHVAARSLGIQLQFAGNVAHAKGIRHWPVFRRPPARPGSDRFNWREVMSAFEELRFAKVPLVKVLVSGDARSADGLTAEVNCSVPTITAPWGSLDEVMLNLRRVGVQSARPPHPIEMLLQLSRASVHSNAFRGLLLGALFEFDRGSARLTNTAWKLELASAEMPRGSVKSITFAGTSHPTVIRDTVDTVPGPERRVPRFDTQFTLQTGALESPWVRVADSRLTGEWRHGLKLRPPESASGELTVHHSWFGEGGNAETAVLGYSLTHLSARNPTNAVASGWREQANQFEAQWDLSLADGAWQKFRVDKLHLAGTWQPPRLRLHDFSAALYEKLIAASASLNTQTRELRAATELDFDLKQLVPLLSDKTQRFFNKFTWETAPRIRAALSAAFPPEITEPFDWNSVKQSLNITGNFSIGRSSYREVPVETAQSSFSFSNRVWSLPDLHVTRPEGGADLAITSAQSPQRFQIGVLGAVHPKAIAPLIGKTGRRVLELFEFKEAAHFTGTIWGPWNEDDHEGIHGVIHATNFNFRGEHFDRLTARVNYTNLFLSATDIDLHRGQESLKAPGAGFDFSGYDVYLTNASSTFDPVLAMRVINPKFVPKIEPYHFTTPPLVVANGSLRVRPETEAHLRFDVHGGQFDWWKFRLPEVRAELFWATNSLTISNFDASFYTGKINGGGRFVFATTNGADYNFSIKIGAADLHSLMVDLSESPNELEGVLNGDLTVGQAKTWDFKSWEGFGSATVRDGLIWDIPVFGIFSSVLNSISPGLGNARVEQAAGNFVITNSVLRTDDLEFRGPTMRLQYRGTVDFGGTLNARVEAELLRDTWAKFFGLVLSPMTKLFEFKLTGTLSQPHKEPLHLFPRVMLMPFQPKTWKDLFGIEDKPPPGKTPPPPKP